MASTYVYRDCDATADSGYTSKFTISAWVKRGTLGEQGIFMQRKTSHVSQSRIRLRFTSADRLGMDFKDSTSNDDSSFETNAKFKDPNAWMHVVWSFDSTQGTEANRLKVWVNGVDMRNDGGGFSSINEASNGFGALFSSAARSMLGITTNNSNQDAMFDGCMSHVHFTYGYTYDATTFGSTDATTGEWKINTSPTIANYGSQGFFVLKDGNSGTDQSGQSNDMTIAGGTLTKTEDNPSNVFCTMNLLGNVHDQTFTAGNTSVQTVSGNGSHKQFFGTLGISSGKFYWELKNHLATTSSSRIGISSENVTSETDSLSGSGGHVGDSQESYAYVASNGYKETNDGQSSYGNSFTNGDILMVALDMDNLKLYFGKNGTWQNSGDPTSGSTGTGAAFTVTSGLTYFPACSILGGGGESYQFNFGNGYFKTTAVSSAGTNASGIGIFEYDVPTGYTALCTKGLNE